MFDADIQALIIIIIIINVTYYTHKFAIVNVSDSEACNGALSEKVKNTNEDTNEDKKLHN